MIIKLHGETTIEKFTKVLTEVISDIQRRAELTGTPFTVKDAEVGILFDVNGEKMMLSAEHDGMAETFKVHVELDEDGDIKAKKDNEKESFVDDYTKAISKGLEFPTTEEIESVFKDADLEEVGREDGGDLIAVYYTHKKTGEKVVRYFREGILVGEMGYKNK